MAIKVDPNWWRDMFDEVYLLTDARTVCDEEITVREVDLICRLLPMHVRHKILDLCGGQGRHSLELCYRGFNNCTLLDYSEYLLGHAKFHAAKRNCQIQFVEADARDTGLPDESFDHVLIMGNSLGYLLDQHADRHILTEANRVLRPQGWLLIDVVDGAALKASFNPSSWHEIGEDIVVCRQREILVDRVHAREVVLSKQKGLIRDRTYSVKLYDATALKSLMIETGFSFLKSITQFSSRSNDLDCGFMNMRMILIGRKVSQAGDFEK